MDFPEEEELREKRCEAVKSVEIPTNSHFFCLHLDNSNKKNYYKALKFKLRVLQSPS